MPAMRRLRSQIIHGDVHPHNVIVGSTGLRERHHRFRRHGAWPLILDLANAAGDFLSPAADPEETIFEMVRGYRSLAPLEEQRLMPDRSDRGAAADDAAGRCAEVCQRHPVPGLFPVLQQPQHADDQAAEKDRA
jgi:hypothetical protein